MGTINKEDLSELLAKATCGRGPAGVSLISRDGEKPLTFWLPATPEEPAFLAYSITKTITAAIVLKLCEEGLLNLDDSLARWFPHIHRADRISLRHLLNHTAGIPDYGGNRTYHESVCSSSETPWPFERFAAETFDKGLTYEPGKGWAYSNPGYMLVKRIIEEITGMSYRALVEERIARPFRLHRTFVPESIGDLESLAPGTSCYISPDGTPRDVRRHYHPGWVSHGVVASTPSEIVRFLDGLFHGSFLSPSLLAHMTELVAVPEEPAKKTSEKESPPRWVRPSYGLGLMGDPASPWGLILGHNGGGPCYSTSVFHAVHLHATVCVMGAIEEGFSAETILFEVLDTVATTRR